MFWQKVFLNCVDGERSKIDFKTFSWRTVRKCEDVCTRPCSTWLTVRFHWSSNKLLPNYLLVYTVTRCELLHCKSVYMYSYLELIYPYFLYSRIWWRNVLFEFCTYCWSCGQFGMINYAYKINWFIGEKKFGPHLPLDGRELHYISP